MKKLFLLATLLVVVSFTSCNDKKEDILTISEMIQQINGRYESLTIINDENIPSYFTIWVNDNNSFIFTLYDVCNNEIIENFIFTYNEIVGNPLFDGQKYIMTFESEENDENGYLTKCKIIMDIINSENFSIKLIIHKELLEYTTIYQINPYIRTGCSPDPCE